MESAPVSSGMGMGLGLGTGVGTALITKTDGKNRAGFDYLFASLSPQYPTYSR